MFKKINNILALWDPIGVGFPIAESEYTQYVSQIITLKDNRLELEKYIIKILDDIGLLYNSSDQLFIDDIQSLIDRIQKVN